ncbi:MAG: trypsin-like peptidase domain-containing protein [Spirochaetales bacterium]|uniref:Trypsin-like peptidase domain-containing protein n=1 Tax=Candidatus Thalassospirochaeta sargassi TaxID=3119039 RepID=A0AAJ1MPU6_9SPIO|nr:trypsin-like peptidase domain-containing protein [Spirochaetales bacterium]
MKLYSRGQVMIISISAVLLAFFLIIGFGLLKFPGKDKPEIIDLVEEPEFEIQQSSIAETNLLQVSDYSSYSEEELNTISIYERLNEAVVNISTETMGINFFLEPVPMEGGTGSGSIIDTRGFVLTNYHVVEDAYKVFITLYDGTTMEGEVIGRDQENDLAIIKFDPDGKELTTINFGSSSNLRVGQKVLAIGNPYGYDRTLTVGIVSGLGRPVKTSSGLVIQGMIQTDASINPGNSGGPLLDSQGRMIGINTMIYSPTGGSVGIGFSVPVDTASRVVPDLIRYGEVKRGWINIKPIQLDRNIVRYAELPVSEGLLVSEIARNGNADEAGIRGGDTSRPVRYGRDTIYLGGDIIVEIDGFETETIADMFTALEDNKPGEVIDVVVIRKKQKKTLKVELSERAEGLSWD